MALYKEKIQRDGIPTNYHRIASLSINVNENNIISVLSYVDNSARTKEKSAVIEYPYQCPSTYTIDYDENMTVESAYEYLKTLPEFEGATDV